MEGKSSVEVYAMQWRAIAYHARPSRLEAVLKRRNLKGTVLLEDISGHLKFGEMLAVMGPSGAGKSTLLDVLAGRSPASSGVVAKTLAIPNRDLSCYVEQHDALLGVLTVHETLHYSARLSMSGSASAEEIQQRVDIVIDGLGLRSVASHRIGTPIQRGISGGQKRRVSIGCSLVVMPSILFLDEPTSGLDIHTAYEVMSSIARFARMHNIAICATIHSPNIEIFRLFSDVMLLAKGRTIYYGSVRDTSTYFASLGLPCPSDTNPADHMLRLVGDPFEKPLENGLDGGDLEQGTSSEVSVAPNAKHGPETLKDLQDHWARRDPHARSAYDESNLKIDSSASRRSEGDFTYHVGSRSAQNTAAFMRKTLILIERNMLNYRRNILAYGVRAGMYVGMGILLATIWVNLAQIDAKIQDRLSIHFFSVAFLGFMSVAGIPSFLEERSVVRRERGNGLYGPGAYVVASTAVMLPFLFICSLVFAVICYWSIGLHPGAAHFFRWLFFLYLGVLAAEMQSLLIAAMVPVFVAALALAAFLNGFWMCTQGYFISTASLPRFWYYWAHFINYETWAFSLLVTTDFKGLKFACENDCKCSYLASPNDMCAISGESVINELQANKVSIGGSFGILLSIIVIYRLLFYVVLKCQKE